jgi:tight adherence protein B
MEQLLLIILVSATAASLAWAAIGLVQNLSAPERRRLQQRLSNDSFTEQMATPSRPLLLQEEGTGLPKILGNHALAQRMQRWLTQGYPHTRLSNFLILVAAFAFTTGSLAGLLAGNWVMTCAGAILGAVLPGFFVSKRRKKRRNQFNQQLPDALDFLSRVLRSGQSLNTGLQMMADELPQPLAAEFRRCYDQHSLGQSLEDGLRDMARRLDSGDFAFFATAVIIQRQSGGDLAEVLHNISGMIRKRLRLAQTVRAKTSEGRLTGYVMVAFPAIMFAITYFIDPKRGGIMLFTPAGHVLTGVAIGLQAIGLFLIRKITTVNA